MLIWLSTYIFSTSSEHIPSGTPEVVIVTVLDEATMSQDYRDRIIENRKYYARKQGMYNDRYPGMLGSDESQQATQLSSLK